LVEENGINGLVYIKVDKISGRLVIQNSPTPNPYVACLI